MITQDRLIEVLRYNPNTGIFIRRIAKGGKPVGSIAGGLDMKGYVVIRIGGKTYKAHRLAWLYVMGRFPDGQIDHINGDKSFNAIWNLRDVTHTENNINRKVQRNNKTGFKGVSIRPSGTFYSQITINGKRVHLGSFSTAEEAHMAYLEMRNEVYGCNYINN